MDGLQLESVMHAMRAVSKQSITLFVLSFFFVSFFFREGRMTRDVQVVGAFRTVELLVQVLVRQLSCIRQLEQAESDGGFEQHEHRFTFCLGQGKKKQKSEMRHGGRLGVGVGGAVEMGDERRC